MEKNINLAIHNRFDIEVVDARTGKVRQKAQAKNIICNNLYANLCNSTNQAASRLYFNSIYWGSGTGTPAVTDTDLFHREGKKTGTNSTFAVDYATKVASCTRMIQLDEQTSVGVEISEVGIGNDDASNGVCTHAMLEDMNGNPITIEKTDVDIINIYATVFIHWSNTSHGSINWGDNAVRNFFFGISRSGRNSAPYEHAFYNLAYATKELYPFWRGGNFTNYYFQYGNQNVTVAGDAANKKYTVTVSRYPVERMNIKGMGAFWFGYDDDPAMCFPVDEFYSGDDITNEAVGTGDGETTRFALKFDFAENASIYVNGVKKTSGVTVNRICMPPAAYDYPGGGAQPGLYVRALRSESTLSKKEIAGLKLYPGDAQESLPGGVIRKFFPMTAGRMIENTAYELGYKSIKNTSTGKIYASNDLTNWVLLADANAGTVELTGAEQHYKYWKNEGSAQADLNWNDIGDGCAVIFDTAPAVGDVITANYHTPYVAKDADHVFDLKVTFQFGEYTE